MEEKYLICEDSIEGIFTGIYDAYALREGHEHLHLQIGEEDNYKLFATYLYSEPDPVKTDKVARTLKKKMGKEGYLAVCRAAASYDCCKGEAVYKTVVDAITAGNGARTMENLRNPYVAKAFELSRNTANEAHYEIEFLRFQESEQGFLFARIAPKNNVVAFIMPHFADRLSPENFLVYDEGRKLFGVHPAGKEWFLASAQEGFAEDALQWSDKEENYRKLFLLFQKTIGIKERENRKLQTQMMPLRYQSYMVELQQK